MHYEQCNPFSSSTKIRVDHRVRHKAVNSAETLATENSILHDVGLAIIGIHWPSDVSLTRGVALDENSALSLRTSSVHFSPITARGATVLYNYSWAVPRLTFSRIYRPKVTAVSAPCIH